MNETQTGIGGVIAELNARVGWGAEVFQYTAGIGGILVVIFYDRSMKNPPVYLRCFGCRRLTFVRGWKTDEFQSTIFKRKIKGKNKSESLIRIRHGAEFEVICDDVLFLKEYPPTNKQSDPVF